MTGRHRRIENRRADWLATVAVMVFAVDAAFTPTAGGSESAPRFLFLVWGAAVAARMLPGWRPRAAAMCKGIGAVSMFCLGVAGSAGMPTGDLYWLNSAALWAILLVASIWSAWAINRGPTRVARHAA